MGELAFGKSFNMLKSEEHHHVIRLLADGMKLLGLVSPAPWLARIGFEIPGLANGWEKMFQWSDKHMQERLEKRDAKADITSWFIDAMDQDGATKNARDWLDGDGFGIIIAGSDTTSAALLYIFYYLARDPEQVEKLRVDTDQIGCLDATSLQSLPHLNGVINEALRLNPPVPSAGLRQTSAEGLIVSGHFIPGKTVVAVPVYSLHRLERSFSKPLEFIPERWYASSDLTMNQDGFAPFFRGRLGCVGKNLALMELRLATALLIRHFNVTFPPGPLVNANRLKAQDHFTIVPGELNLVFERRN